MTIKAGNLIRPRLSLGISLEEANSCLLMVLNIDYTGKRPNGAEIISGRLVLCPDGTTDIVGQSLQSQLEKIES